MGCYCNIAVIISVLFHSVRADPDTKLINILCNDGGYDPDDDGYRASINGALADVIANTSGQGYSYYASLQRAFDDRLCRLRQPRFP